MPAGEPPRQRSAFDFGFEADPKQLVLRALFGVRTPLSVEEVLERMAGFTGIEACIIIDKQNGNVRASRGNDPGRTSTFESQAQQAYNKVISLAADLNVTDAESFTLRTGVGAMSFFNSPKVCLAVLQENSAFEPGIRERLTLVTRELSEMIG